MKSMVMGIDKPMFEKWYFRRRGEVKGCRAWCGGETESGISRCFRRREGGHKTRSEASARGGD